MRSLRCLLGPVATTTAFLALTSALGAQPLPWNQVAASTSLTARERAAMASDGNVIYLYGGQVGTTTVGYDDLWSFDGTNWTLITPSGASAGPRSNPGVAWDASRQVLVVYGGMGDPWGTRSDETWEWSATTGWTQMSPAVTPGARWLFNMVYVPGLGCVFHGGNWVNPTTGTAEADNSTWAYDGLNWNLLSTSGPARHNGKLLYRFAQNDLIYFGGVTNGSSTSLAETWRLDLLTGTWSQIVTATLPISNTATGGPGLVGAGACIDEVTGKIIVHGGQGNGGPPSSATWEFDGTDWKDVTWAASSPGVRNFDLVWLPAATKAYTGCGNFSGTARNYTWERGPQTYGLFTIMGTDCPTSAGLTGTISVDSMPAVGSTVTLQFDNLTPTAAPVVLMGSSNVSYVGIPLPLLMSSILPGSGAGCSVQVSLDYGQWIPASTGTSATLPLPIPMGTGILGFSAYVQCLQVEFAGAVTAANTKHANMVIGQF
ncbi:MAG: hypothetical protein H6834_09785 [Planctomycetes bacterium]|nr:hypothetical protein [Planctomycetota bacterium]